MAVVGALVSLLRGKQFYYNDNVVLAPSSPGQSGRRDLEEEHYSERNGRSPARADSPAGADDSGAVSRWNSASPRQGGSA